MSIIAGGIAKFKLDLTNPDTDAPEDATGALALTLTAPDGTTPPVVSEPVKDAVGKYHLAERLLLPGLWHYLWTVGGKPVAEGHEEVESERLPAPPDLTDLKVLVPKTRRAIEGPFGPPTGKQPLSDTQVYELTADACAEVILFTGKLFSHELRVKTRDPLGGYPTAWKTDEELTEWEAAFIANQAALNYFYHLFRDLKTSEKISNEGTDWEYTISANVMKGYLETLIGNRELALKAMMEIHPVIDRFASNIRVRDQATVAVLEWWAGSFDQGGAGGGLPGGQEAAVVPVFFPPGA